MHNSSASRALLYCILFFVLGGIECEDDIAPNVAEGRYRAHVSGGLVDTLEGPARFQPRSGTFRGIELGAATGTGFSIEIGAEPIEPGVYDVVAAELVEGPHADSLKGVVAFFQLGNAEFETEGGSLSITHVDEDEMRGTFEFEMQGYASGSPNDLSILVEGSLRAIPE